MSLRVIGTVVGAVALVSYAVYFDYKRRSDPDFRRHLRKHSRILCVDYSLFLYSN